MKIIELFGMCLKCLPDLKHPEVTLRIAVMDLENDGVLLKTASFEMVYRWDIEVLTVISSDYIHWLHAGLQMYILTVLLIFSLA
jgi:hypothetical protein